MKKIVFFLMILSVLGFSQRRTMWDAPNSSTTLLDSAATFSGEVTNSISNGSWSSIAVSVYNNHAAGVSGTLRIRFSTDGTNWTETNSYTITTDTESAPRVLPITSRYYQVLFVNGAEIQTEFRLSTMLFEDDMSVGDVLSDSVAVTIANTVAVSAGASVGNDTFGYATNSISAVEVLGGAVTTKKVLITNFTDGTIIYIGSDASVTASNGIPLNYLDSYELTVSNLNKVYIISSGTTDVRYSYEN